MALAELGGVGAEQSELVVLDVVGVRPLKGLAQFNDASRAA